MNVITIPPRAASPMPRGPDFEEERRTVADRMAGLPLVPGKDVYALAETAAGALDEIGNLTRMALRWLETPEGHDDISAVAKALITIQGLADVAWDWTGFTAERVGCGLIDEAEVRRNTAKMAARDRWVENATRGG